MELLNFNRSEHVARHFNNALLPTISVTFQACKWLHRPKMTYIISKDTTYEGITTYKHRVSYATNRIAMITLLGWLKISNFASKWMWGVKRSAYASAKLEATGSIPSDFHQAIQMFNKIG